MYEQLTETTAKVTSKRYRFFLDSGENGLFEHKHMIEHFKNDASKLEYFESLLESNPSTAFMTYLVTHPISNLINNLI